MMAKFKLLSISQSWTLLLYIVSSDMNRIQTVIYGFRVRSDDRGYMDWHFKKYQLLYSKTSETHVAARKQMETCSGQRGDREHPGAFVCSLQLCPGLKRGRIGAGRWITSQHPPTPPSPHLHHMPAEHNHSQPRSASPSISGLRP